MLTHRGFRELDITAKAKGSVGGAAGEGPVARDARRILVEVWPVVVGRRLVRQFVGRVLEGDGHGRGDRLDRGCF
jgi:hypothetical protein